MPFFSVVIPTYNRATRVAEALYSVIAQTCQDFEVLVMDDGSTDNTRQVVASFGDPRIRFATAANSGGPATPRNKGIEMAVGEWICFLDSDDIWYPEKLAEVHRAIRECRDVDAACHDVYEIQVVSKTRRLVRCGPFDRNLYRTMLSEGNRCLTSAMAVRKSFLNFHALRFNESKDHVIVEDYDLWLRMALAGAVFKRVPLALGEYRVADGISLRAAEHLSNWHALLVNHVYHVQQFEPRQDRLWRRVIVQHRFEFARQLLVNKRWIAALLVGAWSLVSSPFATVLFTAARVRGKWHQRR